MVYTHCLRMGLGKTVLITRWMIYCQFSLKSYECSRVRVCPELKASRHVRPGDVVDELQPSHSLAQSTRQRTVLFSRGMREKPGSASLRNVPSTYCHPGLMEVLTSSRHSLMSVSI